MKIRRNRSFHFHGGTKMGISRLTAMEIFTNAKDLDFTISESGGKFAVVIRRGPGHNFKLLADNSHVLSSMQVAVDVIRDLLIMICEVGGAEFSDPSSPIKHVVNPDNAPIETAENILRPDDINKICATLLSTRRAQTY